MCGVRWCVMCDVGSGYPITILWITRCWSVSIIPIKRNPVCCLHRITARLVQYVGWLSQIIASVGVACSSPITESAPASPATPETRSIDPLSWNSPAKPAAAFVITPLKPSFHVNGDSKHDDKDVETGDLKKLHEKRPSASTAAAATASSATAIAGTSNSTDASTAAAAVAATAGTMPAASASTTAPTSTAATTADEGSDDEEYRNWKSKQSISMDQPIAILPSRLSAASSASASAAAPTSTSGSLVAYADDDLDFSNDGMDVNNQPVSAQPKSKIDLANSLGLSSVTAQFASAVGTNSNAIVPPLAFHHIPIPAVHNPSNKPLNNSAATSGFHTPRKSTASSAALSSSVASSSSTALPMTPSSVQQTPPLTPIQPSPETAAKLKELRVQPPTLSPAPATPGVPEVEVVDAAEFDRIPGRVSNFLIRAFLHSDEWSADPFVVCHTRSKRESCKRITVCRRIIA